MNKLIGTLALAALIGAGAQPALAQPGRPNARIEFHGGSVAFIAGVHWGGGVLIWHGRRYPIQVNGLNVGAIGADTYQASGEVYHLRSPRDIEGTYAAVNASATAGEGAGVLDMTDGNGVEIRVTSQSQGLKLSLAPSGVDIRLK